MGRDVFFFLSPVEPCWSNTGVVLEPYGALVMTHGAARRRDQVSQGDRKCAVLVDQQAQAVLSLSEMWPVVYEETLSGSIQGSWYIRCARRAEDRRGRDVFGQGVLDRPGVARRPTAEAALPCRRMSWWLLSHRLPTITRHTRRPPLPSVSSFF